MILFFCGFILHFFHSTYARFMYSIVLFFYVIKLLQLFSLSKKIGVYIVMLQKMVSKTKNEKILLKFISLSCVTRDVCQVFKRLLEKFRDISGRLEV